MQRFAQDNGMEATYFRAVADSTSSRVDCITLAVESGCEMALFGLAKTISSAYSAIPWLAGLGLSPYIYRMLPYVFTILMLVITSRNPQAPKAVGKPYVSSV